MKGRVDYLTEGWCKHCGEKHKYTECKFLSGYYRCPECKRAMRMKAKYNYEMRRLHQPYIPSKYKSYVQEIKELGNQLEEKSRME